MFCDCLTKTDDDIINSKDYDFFIPPIKNGLVSKVYDGDTITIISSIPGFKNKTKYKFSVRLSNIDCPELRSKNVQEKEIAIIARDQLKDLILDKMVYLENISIEKYGRLFS